MGKVGQTNRSRDIVHVHFKTDLSHVALEPEIFTLVVALVAVDSIPPRQSEFSQIIRFGKHMSPPSPVVRCLMACKENVQIFPCSRQPIDLPRHFAPNACAQSSMTIGRKPNRS